MAQDPEPNPLELVSLEAIVAELGTRFDTVVIAGTAARTHAQAFRFERWKGSPLAAIGLCSMLTHTVNQYLDTPSTEETPTDDDSQRD